jgi:hypothetical protein
MESFDDLVPLQTWGVKLRNAAFEGNTLEINRLLAKEPSPVEHTDEYERVRNSLLWEAVGIAASKGHKQLVDHILAHPRVVSKANGLAFGFNTIINAASGDPDIAGKLLGIPGVLQSIARRKNALRLIIAAGGDPKTVEQLLKLSPTIRINAAADYDKGLRTVILDKNKIAKLLGQIPEVAQLEIMQRQEYAVRQTKKAMICLKLKMAQFARQALEGADYPDNVQMFEQITLKAEKEQQAGARCIKELMEEFYSVFGYKTAKKAKNAANDNDEVTAHCMKFFGCPPDQLFAKFPPDYQGILTDLTASPSNRTRPR